VPAKKVGGNRPGGGGKKGKRLAPIKVAERRDWGQIIMFGAVGLLVVGIIAYAAWPSIKSAVQGTWKDQAEKIPGIMVYGDPKSANYDANVANRNHIEGSLKYDQSPPVGGNHNPTWMNCMGTVYTSQIANENAVHSLEHGTVWITYRPDLPQDQIAALAAKVKDVPYMMMSPYPGLDSAISLQSWGFQLKVDNASDGRIDDFIKDLRLNNSQETGAVCSGGITVASATPQDSDGVNSVASQ
jgi:hypothetical protein